MLASCMDGVGTTHGTAPKPHPASLGRSSGVHGSPHSDEVRYLREATLWHFQTG
jgi:hypothetical protein